MNLYKTYPNNFRTDTIYIDNPLSYSFNETNIFKIPLMSDDKYTITNNILKQDGIQVKYNNLFYNVNSISLSTKRDIIDNNIEYKFILYINCKSSYSFLSIGIPVKLVDKLDKMDIINNLFTQKTENEDNTDLLNDLIPLNKYYYSYYTLDQNYIIYKDSDLVTTYNNLKDYFKGKYNDKTLITKQNIPLTISKDYAKHLTIITTNVSDNDIYIDCSPVQEKGSNMDIAIFTTKEKTFRNVFYFFEILVSFIVIFLLFYYITKPTNKDTY